MNGESESEVSLSWRGAGCHSPGVALGVVARARSGVLLSRCEAERMFAQRTGVQRADREKSVTLAPSRVSSCWCGAKYDPADAWRSVTRLSRGEMLLG